MRIAVQPKVNRSRPEAISASVSAPHGGWNARDDITEMPKTDASLLVNWFPSEGKVDLRNGYQSYATGMTSAVESLMEYSFGTTNKLFAAADNSIFDVSSNGAVGAAAVTGLTNNRWQHENFGTAGGNFLVMCNGADAVRNYNGSTWSTPSITGFTSANSIQVHAFKKRLWFVEKNTLKAHYLPVVSIAGAATEFDLSSQAGKGGYLMAMGSWSVDGGNGMDDLAVFITSKGEVIIYQGTDPSSASTWAQVGIFQVGPPVGRRCLFQIGPDLIIITQDGFFPISKALLSDRAANQVAISDKIRKAVNTAVKNYGSNFGWQPILHPKGNMGIFNIPIQEGTTAEQYVVNTITGAWTKFTNQNANVWSLYADDLYFGGVGTVYKADTGSDDNGSNIEADVEQAYSDFGKPGRLKQFTMARPIYESDGVLNPVMDMNIDFQSNEPTSTPTFTAVAESPWDTSDWDTSDWGGATLVKKDWQGIGGIGYAAALRKKLASKDLNVSWLRTDYLYIPGEYI